MVSYDNFNGFRPFPNMAPMGSKKFHNIAWNDLDVLKVTSETISIRFLLVLWSFWGVTRDQFAKILYMGPNIALGLSISKPYHKPNLWPWAQGTFAHLCDSPSPAITIYNTFFLQRCSASWASVQDNWWSPLPHALLWFNWVRVLKPLFVLPPLKEKSWWRVEVSDDVEPRSIESLTLNYAGWSEEG